MKIALLGTANYQESMLRYQEDLEEKGHEVKIPAFDFFPDKDELGVCDYNLEAIKWADEIHTFWDGRSPGFLFDFGMCYALGKKMIPVYTNPKSFVGLLKKYSERG